eukprot:1683775-Prymnesium_polylepis.1
MVSEILNGKKAELARAKAAHEELVQKRAKCCSTCCGPKMDEVNAAAAVVARLEQGCVDAEALYPWNKCSLRSATEVAKAWGDKQVELLKEFSQVLLQMQKRTSGTLGFTLHDEWRYLNYRKDAPFVDVARTIVDAQPIPPHVSNPHDREWDVLDKFGNDSFAASDVTDRLPMHRAFREACNAASALHPDLQEAGTCYSGDYVRFEGGDVVVSRA